MTASENDPVRTPLPGRRQALAFPFLLLIAGLAIAVWTAWYSFSWHSPVPFYDQWMEVVASRDFNDFIRQHNEHRIVFPRLIFQLDDVFGGQQYVNYAGCLVLSGVISYYGYRLIVSEEDGLPRRLVVAATCIALSFFAVQFANYSWGFQVQFIGVYAAAIYAMFCSVQTVRPDEGFNRASFAKCLAAVLVATFCMANGFLVGLCAAVFFLVADWAVRWRLALATFLFTGALTFLYFLDFHLVKGHTSPSDSLSDPVRMLKYVCGVIGSMFGNPVGFYMGAALIVLGLVLALVVLLRKCPPRETALLGIAAFVAASAILIALGRSEFPLNTASSSRYSTPSVVLVMVIFGLVTLTVRPKRWQFGVATALSGGLLAYELYMQPTFEKHFEARWQARRIAEVSLINGVVNDDVARNIFPAPELLDARLAILRDQRRAFFARKIASAPGTRIGDWGETIEAGTNCAGYFDQLVPAIDRQHTVRGEGWAVIDGEPAHAVFLVGGDGKIAAIGLTGFNRPDVAQSMGSEDASKAGWRSYFPAANAVGRSIRAYAYSKRFGVCQLKNERRIDADSLTVSTGLWSDAVELGDPELSGAFAPLAAHASAGLPGADVDWWASWSGADSNTGAAVWSLQEDLPPNAKFQFYLVLGPDGAGQHIDIIDSDGEVIKRYSFAAGGREWLLVEAPLPAGEDIASIRVSDEGRGWGQWVGVGGMRIAPASAD